MDEKDRKKNELIAKVLQSKNLYKAYRQVADNKGSCGVDLMEVTELQEYLSTHQRRLVREILADQYLPQAIRGVEIPKSNDERKNP
jgi:retron-type reverse transcriptase